MCYSNPSKERFQFNFLKTLRADGTIKTFWSDLLHRVFTQSLPSRSPEHTETNTPFWKAWYLNLHLKNLLLYHQFTLALLPHTPKHNWEAQLCFSVCHSHPQPMILPFLCCSVLWYSLSWCHEGARHIGGCSISATQKHASNSMHTWRSLVCLLTLKDSPESRARYICCALLLTWSKSIPSWDTLTGKWWKV